MKHIAAGLALALACATASHAAMPDWHALPNTNGVLAWMDMANVIPETNGWVKYWVRFEEPVPEQDGTKVVVSLFEADCAGRMRILEAQTYADHDMERYLAQQEGDGVWTYPVPGTFNAVVAEAVCANKHDWKAR